MLPYLQLCLIVSGLYGCSIAALDEVNAINPCGKSFPNWAAVIYPLHQVM